MSDGEPASTPAGQRAATPWAAPSSAERAVFEELIASGRPSIASVLVVAVVVAGFSLVGLGILLCVLLLPVLLIGRFVLGWSYETEPNHERELIAQWFFIVVVLAAIAGAARVGLRGRARRRARWQALADDAGADDGTVGLGGGLDARRTVAAFRLADPGAESGDADSVDTERGRQVAHALMERLVGAGVVVGEGPLAEETGWGVPFAVPNENGGKAHWHLAMLRHAPAEPVGYWVVSLDVQRGRSLRTVRASAARAVHEALSGIDGLGELAWYFPETFDTDRH